MLEDPTTFNRKEMYEIMSLYFEQVTKLVSNPETPDINLSLLRIWTNNLLKMLDDKGRHALLSFILKTELIHSPWSILKDIDLSNFLLQELDFKSVTFDGVNFSRATIQHCYIAESSFLNCTFQDTKFDDAHFHTVRFSGQNNNSNADFTSCILENMDFSFFSLRGFYFDETCALESKWDVVWKLLHRVKGTINQGSDIPVTTNEENDDSLFSISPLDYTKPLFQINQHKTESEEPVEFLENRIDSLINSNPDLTNTDLSGVVLDGLYLRDINFSGSILTGSSFQGAVLENCKFERCKLEQANFEQAILLNNNFEQAYMDKDNLLAEVKEAKNVLLPDGSSITDFTQERNIPMNSNSQLASEGLGLISQMGESKVLYSNDNTVAYQIGQNHLATAHFIAHKAPVTPLQQAEILALLDKKLNWEDTRTLCFNLGVDFDSIGGEGKAGKQRELILYLDRHGRLTELAPAANHIVVNLLPTAVVVRHIPQPNLAIITDFNFRRPIYSDVAVYLDNQQLACNTLLFLPNQKPIPQEDWQPFATLFQQALANTTVNEQVRHYHFFLGGPLALTFHLGAIWGTIRKANVYHLGDNGYLRVFSK